MDKVAIRLNHCAIYIRWSTDEQGLGTTCDVQLHSCLALAEQNGWKVNQDMIVVDAGFSGGDLHRPGITRLRELVRAGEVDCVIVYKLDRLSRNIIDATHLVLKEWGQTCHLIAVRENFETTSDLGRMQFAMLAIFAEMEREWIRDRNHSGRLRRLESGEIKANHAPFGYQPLKSKPGLWKENLTEANIVRLIFRLAAEGNPPSRIAQLVNESNHRTRRGHRFTSKAISYILTNRAYVGETVWGTREVKRIPMSHVSFSAQARIKTYVTKHISRDVPKVHVKSTAAPAIVPVDLFERARRQQEGIEKLRTQVGCRAMNSPHQLSGLIQCQCGASMTFTSSGNGSYYYYTCSRRKRGGCRYGTRVRTDFAEAAVDAAFLQEYGSATLRQESLRRRLLEADRDRLTISDQVARMREHHQRALERQPRVLDLIRRSGDNELLRLYDRQLRNHEDNIQTALRLSNDIEDEIAEAHRNLAELQIADRWEQVHVERKRLVLHRVLEDRIVIERSTTKRVSVTCRWQVSPRIAIRKLGQIREDLNPQPEIKSPASLPLKTEPLGS